MSVTNPASQAATAGGSVSFTVAASDATGFRWLCNGVDVSGATSATLALGNVQPAVAGLCQVRAFSAPTSAISQPAILGITTTAKVIGGGGEVGSDLRSLYGFVYDALLLTGAAATLRAIELYNTRNGTVRTGCYTVDPNNHEDGFANDGGRPGAAIVAPPKYHSADSNRDGKLDLNELLRVIELYNYRTGTVRTGQYHAQAGTEDGFATGP